jgi:hypothetical protein
MSTETGLKRRNITQNNSSNEFTFVNANNNGGQSTGNGNEDVNENESGEENNDEYDADSKETRLTLMEEILLLGLKDKEVSQKSFNEQHHHHHLHHH